MQWTWINKSDIFLLVPSLMCFIPFLFFTPPLPVVVFWPHKKKRKVRASGARVFFCAWLWQVVLVREEGVCRCIFSVFPPTNKMNYNFNYMFGHYASITPSPLWGQLIRYKTKPTIIDSLRALDLSWLEVIWSRVLWACRGRTIEIIGQLKTWSNRRGNNINNKPIW